MEGKSVTSTEFRNRAGQYIDAAAKEPIIITKHQRPSRVLLDIDEYQRLKEQDTRRAIYPHELPDDLAEELEKGFQGRATPELDHLLK